MMPWRTSQPEPLVDAEALLAKYRDLQRYVGWTDDDLTRVAAVRDVLAAALPALIDEFYQTLMSCTATRSVITGGDEQVNRLKASMHRSLSEMLSGPYDQDFVSRRWAIGQRHVQIGLDETYVCVAMSKIRTGLQAAVATHIQDREVRVATSQSLDKLVDLDLAIIQDAYGTQRMRLERLTERQQGDERFRTLVESAAVAVMTLDQRFTLQYLSPFAEKLLGYSTEDLAGQPLVSLLADPTQTATVTDQLQAALADGSERDREFVVLTRHGEQCILLTNIERVTDHQQQPRLLLVAHDTTQWRAANERLMRSERLAGIGQMLAGLAHESRNALQRIGSLAEMIEMEVETNEVALGFVRRLQRAQDDLRRLFDEVRNYAAPVQLDLSECQLTHCFHEAWELVRTTRSNRQVQLIDRSNGHSSRAVVDRFRIVQVLRNLFENSLNACGDPVQIEVEARPVHAAGDRYIQMRVADNGPGITTELRQKIFEPFFTTHTKGTGLGLSIARRVVEAHGGTIMADVARGGGAEFVITLPRGGGAT